MKTDKVPAELWNSLLPSGRERDTESVRNQLRSGHQYAFEYIPIAREVRHYAEDDCSPATRSPSNAGDTARLAVGPVERIGGEASCPTYMVYGPAFISYRDGDDVVISVTYTNTRLVEPLRCVGEIAEAILRGGIIPRWQSPEPSVMVEILAEFHDEWDMGRVIAIRVP